MNKEFEIAVWGEWAGSIKVEAKNKKEAIKQIKKSGFSAEGFIEDFIGDLGIPRINEEDK